MNLRALTAAVLFVPTVLAASQVSQMTKPGAPESFRANGQMLGAAGGAASAVEITIDKYTSDADHEAMLKALKEGHDAVLAALKKAPKIGTITIGKISAF